MLLIAAVPMRRNGPGVRTQAKWWRSFRNFDGSGTVALSISFPLGRLPSIIEAIYCYIRVDEGVCRALSAVLTLTPMLYRLSVSIANRQARLPLIE